MERYNDNVPLCPKLLRVLQAKAARFQCSAVSASSTKRKVRHILVPAEEGELLIQIQEKLEGQPTPTIPAYPSGQHSHCWSYSPRLIIPWVEAGAIAMSFASDTTYTIPSCLEGQYCSG